MLKVEGGDAMSVISCFEDLDSWRAARDLAREIYQCTRRTEFARDFGLKDQIRRAIVSVISNLAEGFERESNQEKIRFYGFAKSSAGEVRAQLYIALDQAYISPDEFGKMKLAVTKVSNLIGGMIRYLASDQANENHSVTTKPRVVKRARPA